MGNSVIGWTRRLIELRKENAALHHGGIRLLDEQSDQLIAFERHQGAEHVCCVFNLSDLPAQNPVGSGTLLLSTGGADLALPALPPSSGFVARC